MFTMLYFVLIFSINLIIIIIIIISRFEILPTDTVYFLSSRQVSEKRSWETNKRKLMYKTG